MFPDNKKISLIVVIVAVLLLIYSFSRSFFDKPTRSITAIGVGTKQVSAEKAVITFAISRTSQNRNTAVQEGQQFADSIVRSLSNLKPSSVKQTAYQLTPTRTFGQTVSSYQYATGIQVTIEGGQNIDQALTFLNGQDVTIAQVRYLAMDEKQVGSEVREMALQDAREKAEQIARASGGRIGKVLAVSEEVANDQSGSSVTGGNTEEGTGTFKEVEIQSVITATFELK